MFMILIEIMLEAASGTVYHPSPPQLQRQLFSRTVSSQNLSRFPIISFLTVFGF